MCTCLVANHREPGSNEEFTQPKTSQRQSTRPTHPAPLLSITKYVPKPAAIMNAAVATQRCETNNCDQRRVKKYGLNMLVSSDDQVKAYIKKIMSQLDKWMQRGKISKLVIVITDKDTGEHVERWQFDVQIFNNPTKSSSGKSSSSKSSKTKPAAAASENAPSDQENAASNDTAAGAAPVAAEKSETEIQAEIAALFRQITASVTFLPQLSGGDCTFNVLVYADADSDVPVEWGDSDAKEIVNGERVQLRGFSTSNHRVETLVSYRLGD